MANSCGPESLLKPYRVVSKSRNRFLETLLAVLGLIWGGLEELWGVLEALMGSVGCNWLKYNKYAVFAVSGSLARGAKMGSKTPAGGNMLGLGG